MVKMLKRTSETYRSVIPPSEVTNPLTAIRLAFTNLQKAYSLAQQGDGGRKEAQKLVIEAEAYAGIAKVNL